MQNVASVSISIILGALVAGIAHYFHIGAASAFFLGCAVVSVTLICTRD